MKPDHEFSKIIHRSMTPIAVASVYPRIKKPLKELLRAVVLDYCQRHNRQPKMQCSVDIALIEPTSDDKLPTKLGVTTAVSGPHILVQVIDPYINGKEQMHPSVHLKFLSTVCHEFVHVAQHLTETDGDPLDKELIGSSLEKYHLSFREAEANRLEALYLDLYAIVLLPMP